ncbi:MAG: DUF971 domain-containing protein [Elusimicrobia bacterium]|nr:DUF971 domain-containing protein [Elusimicrobiota bacterium]
MSKTTDPREIKNIQDKELEITWEDGHVSRYSFQYLRQRCACALCQHEWTGEKLLDAAQVPQDLQIQEAAPVGNYALHFRFSDGHATGIYPFEKLRELCPCGPCSNPAGHAR